MVSASTGSSPSADLVPSPPLQNNLLSRTRAMATPGTPVSLIKSVVTRSILRIKKSSKALSTARAGVSCHDAPRKPIANEPPVLRNPLRCIAEVLGFRGRENKLEEKMRIGSKDVAASISRRRMDAFFSVYAQGFHKL